MKHLQLRRNTIIYENRDLAEQALKNQISTLVDGEELVASYYTKGKVAYLIGIFNEKEKSLYIADYQGLSEKLDDEIDELKSQISSTNANVDILSGKTITFINSSDNTINLEKTNNDDGTIQYNLESNLGITYDDESKEIKLVSGSSNTIKADNLFKDGMVNDVRISDDKSSVIVSWNKDSNHQDIVIKVKDLIRLYNFESGTIVFNTKIDEETGVETISADINKIDCGTF